MKASDKICVALHQIFDYDLDIQEVGHNGAEEYIRKDALLKWAEKELERLWELVPDSDKVENKTATPMETRYLGQYMQMESVIDKLNEM